MFENLSEKLQNTLKRLRGKGRLTEADINEAMREVRVALLEADVNFKVVRDFVGRIKEKAMGAEILESLTPGQQVVKIVYDELVEMIGGTQSKLTVSSKLPTIIMLVGLQGAGKTTAAGKLANYLRKQGKKPLLVACDVYRPAAIEQLHVLGKQLGIPVYDQGQGDPVDIAKLSIGVALSQGRDTVLLDTAGRLHVDENMMDELKRIKASLHPHEILLIVDAMTGQDAVNVAGSFSDQIGIDGVILTKMDGDTRGGAALSIKTVTGKPIKFISSGEKMDTLEPFYPDRLASRILGMGDVMTLIEKAQENVDLEQAKAMEAKLRKNELDLDDFLKNMQQIKKMGPLSQLMKMIPGLPDIKEEDLDQSGLKKMEAIIQSMTLQERRKPELLNASRRKRIAAGSGTRVQDVNRMLKDFEETKKMMQQMTRASGKMQKTNQNRGNSLNPFGRIKF
ncbi:MAG: signal recognition particle protein [Negativicutes bacterium]|nr:signal recognition particle protein [Negativicutes bacterium]